MAIGDQVVSSPLEEGSVTIANAASLSGGMALGGLRLFGFVMPDPWTSAAVTFQASYDGGVTWVNMYDANGVEISASVAASRLVVLDPVIFAAVPMVRLRSGTSAMPVTQGGDRVIKLIARSV